jgi:hypothetical protein
MVQRNVQNLAVLRQSHPSDLHKDITKEDGNALLHWRTALVRHFSRKAEADRAAARGRTANTPPQLQAPASASGSDVSSGDESGGSGADGEADGEARVSWKAGMAQVQGQIKKLCRLTWQGVC